MEGATKWDPVGGKTSDGSKQIFGRKKLLNQRPSDAPVISTLQTQLEQARARINELETDHRSSKKKLEQFLQKLSEKRAEWRSREHEKIRAIIDDMKAELNREKKNRQKLEIVNSKLVNELADAKTSLKRYLQEYNKERKARELIEEVCEELAQEIGEDKAEVDKLKRESMKLWEEVEDERKMLQMAEVWREERVQMKLVDAKVMLEEKYSQMNRIITDLEAFLNSRGMSSDLEDMKKAKFLQEVAASVNIQDIREIMYEPPNPDDIFSVFEDINNSGESNEREVEPCTGHSPASHDSKIHTVTPQVKLLNKDGAKVYMDKSGETEEDGSEWETVSHPEDQGSSYSPDGSDPSVNPIPTIGSSVKRRRPDTMNPYVVVVLFNKQNPRFDLLRRSLPVKLAGNVEEIKAIGFRQEARCRNLAAAFAGSGVGHLGTSIHGYHVDRIHSSPAKNLVHSPHFVSVRNNGLQHKFDSSFQFSNSEMEGATKWILLVGKHQMDQSRYLAKKSSSTNDQVTLQEKKNRQKLEIVNSKLVNELADAKTSLKRYLQEYDKERKARELIEEVCEELAQEIGEDKAEVDKLKRESMKLWEEVEDERKMLQMAEVWREERVQMKLVDAKVMLEEKYSQMNRIITDLEAFLNSRGMSSDLEDMKKAKFLQEVAASVNIQYIREIMYEPPNPDDIFSVFEDINNSGESNEREVEPCTGHSPASHDSKIHTVTPQVKLLNKDGAKVYMDKSGETEEDGSEWETVSHPEDQGSSYSPDGSDPSVNPSFRVSNVSREWERNGGKETPIMEISEVGSIQPSRLKKTVYLSNGRKYKIVLGEGVNRRVSNGRLSNGAVMSPECGSGKSGQWSSPDSGNIPHKTQGMKGCIEWPLSAHKSSLKSRLLEARMESQKVQLRQVLKHKI
ncbi:hypothetical protein DH2020_016816 [Rehmannia glutinosa]|uniref:Uncharacterized protein n=1 Tax=Rehmannia glutinosa TaxID=99300 RepID=A0ABR0WQR7_REHGL